jgi:DNA-nicking Smr family endonuclease
MTPKRPSRASSERDWRSRLEALKRLVPETADAPRADPKPGPTRAPSPDPPDEPGHEPARDEDLFWLEMGDVQRLDAGAEIEPVAVPRSAAALPPVASDDERVMEELLRAVEGDAPFRFSESEEMLEGAVRSLDPRVLKKLRRGRLRIDARLDLHGYSAEDARVLLNRFIEAAIKEGRRVVLVVHGKGLHSKDRVPVLKERMKRWLTRSGPARNVLAFTSALPTDGGLGAVYVLLRRRRDPGARPRLTRS